MRVKSKLASALGLYTLLEEKIHTKEVQATKDVNKQPGKKRV